MLTSYNAKQLSLVYNMSESTYHSYLSAHRQALRELATTKAVNGRVVASRSYNSAQLKYLVEQVFKDTPEGYSFNGKTLVRLNE